MNSQKGLQLKRTPLKLIQGVYNQDKNLSKKIRSLIFCKQESEGNLSTYREREEEESLQKRDSRR